MKGRYAALLAALAMVLGSASFLRGDDQPQPSSSLRSSTALAADAPDRPTSGRVGDVSLRVGERVGVVAPGDLARGDPAGGVLSSEDRGPRAAGGPAGPARRPAVQHAQVYWIVVDVPGGHVPGDEVDASRARLVRSPRAVSMQLHTTGLRPGHAYTIWWAIFNQPESCLGLVKMPGQTRCGDPDWANPAAEPSTVWAAGGVASEDGTARFSGRLEVGDTSHNAFPGEPGLTNPSGADISLFVRDHGPKVDGSDQTTTFNGGCINYVPIGTGSPGTYPCENPQVASFEGR